MADITPTLHSYEVIKPFSWGATKYETGDTFVPADHGCSVYKLEVLQYARHLSSAPVAPKRDTAPPKREVKPKRDKGSVKRKVLARRGHGSDSEGDVREQQQGDTVAGFVDIGD